MNNKKHSDFHNIADSGRACVGCGRGPDHVMLMRLRTYARSLACGACFIKYASCENKNPDPMARVCHHNPTEHRNKVGPCQMAGCGCPRWIHGLESEMDRQLAIGVGASPRARDCTGFGQNTGKCTRTVLAKPDGSLGRLCDPCERLWVQETQERMREAHALLKLDTSKVMPN